MVKVLHRLAGRQHTVLSVLRQPSSHIFSHFDKVLLLTEGRVAFMGTSSEALKFFSNMGEPCPQHFNPADFFIQTLTISGHHHFIRLKAEMAYQSFQNTMQARAIRGEIDDLMQTPDSSRDSVLWMHSQANQEAPWPVQFRVNAWRCWICLCRETRRLSVGFLGVLLMGLMIGGTFYKLNRGKGQSRAKGYDQHDVLSVNGALFTLCTVSGLFQCYFTLGLLARWFPILVRDLKMGFYRLPAFYLALCLVELPLNLLYPFLFVIVDYWMVGLRDGIGGFFFAAAVVLLCANVSASFGHLVWCYAGGDVRKAEVWAAGSLTWLVLVSGFLVNAASVPHEVSWLRHVSWFWHGQKLLMVNQWSSVDHIYCPAASDHSTATTETNSTSQVNGTTKNHTSAESNTTLKNTANPASTSTLSFGALLTNGTSTNVSDALENDTSNTLGGGERWCMFSNGSHILQQFHYSSEGIVYDFLILLLLAVVFRLAAFMFLSRRVKKHAHY